jgi:hypothetical protein
LLTGIVSPDYIDITGNGISGDDLGDAVRFNYSKVCGVSNPYRWRAPYTQDSVTLNEGLKTDNRDDKGNYVYGEKELWYMHSIASKTMVATFVLENRNDQLAIDERGVKYNDGTSKRLKEINLYSKADFIKRGINARPVKTVHFEYSYELCMGVNKPINDSGKLTLKKIWFTYNGNKKGKQNPYVFNYNSKNPDYNIKSYDRWGNFKDPLQNPGSTQNNLITNAEYPFALQDSTMAAKNAAAWALDSINLPSGGSLKVNYESDDYAYVQNKRALQLFKIKGLGSAPDLTNPSDKLYTKGPDNLYVYINIPVAVSSKADILQKYLHGISKFMFRLSVKMPQDDYGSGHEYITCYADLENKGSYGLIDSNLIWVKLSGISLKGNGTGNYSPLAKAGIQFLRMNLPSKAYPGSEVGDNVNLSEAVKMMHNMAGSITTAFSSFDRTARDNGWCGSIDTSRSFVRLNNPTYKKYGGGHRVKKITIYDNWDKMTGQRAAKYGQEYSYTTRQDIDGKNKLISSGVASYEPGIGSEENPFRQPIEYVEKISPMGPVTLGYSEEPLGESMFPSAGVGYSKVRVRTINHKDVKSANGYEETGFYTAYDFPTYTDRSILDKDTKKRFKPALANLLRINARHYITLSQGFKIELNDMHGKMRSQATYPETDPNNPISYTENIYKVEDNQADQRRLDNKVMVINPQGTIDSAGFIGKDVELMVDMREQLSITNGNNASINVDMFSSVLPPYFIVASFYNLPQREENLFRSVATMKVIQRYGIVDSIIHIDKGSKVSTKDLLYDSETGDVLLTKTQNEFNDPVYNFSYPSHWAYDAMGLAYKNIDMLFNHVTIREGKISSGLASQQAALFSSGDEILVSGKTAVGNQTTNCLTPYTTFPSHTKIWAIDSSILLGGSSALYFIDKEGKPYNGFDVSLKVIRSGRKNMISTVGSVTTLENPLVKSNGQYSILLNSASKVINASSGEYRQFWKIGDQKSNKTKSHCVSSLPQTCSSNVSCTSQCLKKLFDYLIASRRLFISQSENILLSTLLQNASVAGFTIATSDCPLFAENAGKPFYALTTDSVTDSYKAKIGDCTISFNSTGTNVVNFYGLLNSNVDSLQGVMYTSGSSVNQDTITRVFNATRPVTGLYLSHDNRTDTASSAIAGYVGNIISYQSGGETYSTSEITSYMNFDSISSIAPNATILSATLNLYANPQGFNNNGSSAHKINDSIVIFVPSNTWTTQSYYGDLPTGGQLASILKTTSSNQNFALDAKPFVEKWISSQGPKYTGLGFKTYYHTYNFNFIGSEYFSFASSLHSNSSLRPKLTVSYRNIDTTPIQAARLQVEICQLCDTISDNTCRSIVMDTAFNPYVTGALGNWRGHKNYVYYGQRSESDPLAQTNIRKNGTFADFTPFWSFENNSLKASEDSSRWVWNSEMTLFNKKGLEIENKDPLGRYNSGLYGYNLSMPTAVIQNAKYREAAFDGFEDYDFQDQTCDTACQGDRHLDFSPYKAKLSTIEKHTGKTSLMLAANEQAALSFSLADGQQDSTSARLTFSTANNTCASNAVLKEIKAGKEILLPSFSPYKGKRMLVSAWVKEEQTCNCASYVNNRVRILFSGGNSTTISFNPSGNLIEGWQRYEGVFDIPQNASGMTVSLEATGATSVFFDDLRIHPFNANMKSFVYNNTDLKLMAELDENNYATFYEYDDDGTLIRVKKETEKGIKTITETRSALVKQ